MKVTNLTNQVQKLVVKPLTGDRDEFNLFVQAKGSTNIDWHFFIKQEDYAGIFSFDDKEIEAPVKIEESTAPEDVVNVDSVEDEPEISVTEEPIQEEVEEPQKEVAPTSYICDLCGAEFGSARGLQSHKNRVHK